LSGRAEEIGIASDTIERVLKAAKDMGYVPSAAALTLKGKATRTIGVAVYDFNDPFFGALIKQIQIQAHEHNYSLILAGFLSRIPDEQDLQSLHKHAIDGLIVLGSDDREAHWLKHFKHLPIARIGHGVATEASVRVTVDEVDAAQQLTDYLVRSGRENPVYLCGPLPAHRLRKAAFRQAAAVRNLQIPSIVSRENDAVAAGRQATRELISTGRTADALICATDQVAIGALQTLHRAVVNVPGKIAVTGFDGIAAAEQFIPSITTLLQPIEEIVRHAFRAIIEPAQHKEILLPGKFIARHTS
jgi:DNA-binding LacI/PurR family transcriptional regulator